VSGGDPRDDLLGRLIEPVRESVGFNPGGVSRWMRRRHRWAGVFIGVFCVAGFGCFVALFVSIGRGGAVLSLAIGGASLPVLGGVLAMVALTRARRQERSAADAACGYACPNCLYDLSAERVERCSECGQRVIYDGLPVLWEGASWRRAWSDPVDKSTGFSRAGLSAWEVVMRRWSRALSLLIPVVCFAPWQTVFHGLGSLAVGVRTGLGGVATVVAMVVLLGPVFVLMFRKKKQLERALRAGLPGVSARSVGGVCGAVPRLRAAGGVRDARPLLAGADAGAGDPRARGRWGGRRGCGYGRACTARGV
jgi:hypothetical protein